MLNRSVNNLTVAGRVAHSVRNLLADVCERLMGVRVVKVLVPVPVSTIRMIRIKEKGP